ncbi:MAG: DUF883 domain-containing protein [Acidobacteria bacterium]|nr:MAG: DUF883 domain-containing protein [Acidobacteriota bacterium]
MPPLRPRPCHPHGTGRASRNRGRRNRLLAGIPGGRPHVLPPQGKLLGVVPLLLRADPATQPGVRGQTPALQRLRPIHRDPAGLSPERQQLVEQGTGAGRPVVARRRVLPHDLVRGPLVCHNCPVNCFRWPPVPHARAPARLRPPEEISMSPKSVPDSSDSAADGSASPLRQQTDTIKEDIRELGNMAREVAQEKLDDARQAAADAVETGRQRATELYGQGREKAEELEEQVVDYVRKKPIKSMLIAGGVGLLLGMVLSSRR